MSGQFKGFRPALLASVALLGLATAAQAVPAIGLRSGTTLFAFDTATPGTASGVVTVTGLQGAETLYGLDYRPATAALYGLGSSGRLYTIDTTTGAATTASTLSTGLSGTSFDISFNPTVDRLRIVSDAGQNLRVNVDTGAVTTDTPLAYAAGDPNVGSTPSIAAAAYTNQVAFAVSTTLYDISGGQNVLATQSPPNNGILNTLASVIPGLISFDIAGDTGIAYAATNASLYTINLTTGATTLLGAFNNTGVSDFTLVQVPEPISAAFLALGLGGLLTARRRSIRQPV